MKRFVRIFRIFTRVLIVLLIISIYFNIGYWSAKSYVNALQKMQRSQDLNIFQRFQTQIGPKPEDEIGQKNEINVQAAMLVYTIFWPIIMLICLGIIIYKFIFLGRFFRIIASLF